MDFISNLLACSNEEQIVATLTAEVKRVAGWEVTSVTFEGTVMTVNSVKHHDGMYQSQLMSTKLLAVDLVTVDEIYGRLQPLGLSWAAVMVIRNVMVKPATA